MLCSQASRKHSGNSHRSIPRSLLDPFAPAAREMGMPMRICGSGRRTRRSLGRRQGTLIALFATGLGRCGFCPKADASLGVAAFGLHVAVV